MGIPELKELLESFKYDNQYLEEKINEISLVKNSSNRTDLYQFTKNYEEKQIKRIIDKKQFIENSFQELKQPYQSLMYMKYISLLSFDEVADKMKLSKSRIYQLHKIAIISLSQKINEKNMPISHYN